MTKIEEVARAIDDACIEYQRCHPELNLQKWDVPGVVMAVAAVSAMREPNEEMLEVATDTSHWGSRICYKAMIDAALAEHK